MHKSPEVRKRLSEAFVRGPGLIEENAPEPRVCEPQQPPAEQGWGSDQG